MSGDHRVTDFRWDGLTDDELADAVDALNAGRGPQAIAPAVDALHDIAKTLYDIDTTLQVQLQAIGINWKAPRSSKLAGDLMERSRNYAGTSGDHFDSTAGLLESQSDSFSRARNGAPPAAALRSSAAPAAQFAPGSDSLVAHGQQDATAAQGRYREVRARAIDSLQGYNQHTNTTFGQHQAMPNPQPPTVSQSEPAVAAGTTTAQLTGGGGGWTPPPPVNTAPPVGAPTVTPVVGGGHDLGAAAGPAPARTATREIGAAPPSGPSGRPQPKPQPSSVPGANGESGGGGTPAAPRSAGSGGGLPPRSPQTGEQQPPAAGAPAGQPGSGSRTEAPAPLENGARTGVGPLPERSLALGRTAIAAEAGGVSAAVANEAGIGSAMAAGAGGAAVAGGAAQQDRLVRGRGAPRGAGASFDETVSSEQPRLPPGTESGYQREDSVLEAPTGRSARDENRVRRHAVEADDLFNDGPMVSQPVLGSDE